MIQSPDEAMWKGSQAMGKQDQQTQRAVQGDPNAGQTAPRQNDPELNPQQQQPGQRQTREDPDFGQQGRQKQGEQGYGQPRRDAGQTERDPHDSGEPKSPVESGQPNRPHRPEGERRDTAGNPRGGTPDERIQPQR